MKKIGDFAIWTWGGVTRFGIVERVIPAQKTTRWHGYETSREHESYIVRTTKPLLRYWPVVRELVTPSPDDIAAELKRIYSAEGSKP
jgi:hypothetical protein